MRSADAMRSMMTAREERQLKQELKDARMLIAAMCQEHGGTMRISEQTLVELDRRTEILATQDPLTGHVHLTLLKRVPR